MSWAAQIEAPDGTLHLVGCGSRDFNRCDIISGTCEQIRYQFPVLTIIEGAADGADDCIGEWAASQRHRAVHWVRDRARWGDPRYTPEERRIGIPAFDRNQRMIDRLVTARDNGHGVAVLAFKQALDPRLFTARHSARGGTEDEIRRAWAHDIPVWHCDGRGAPKRCSPAVALDL